MRSERDSVYDTQPKMHDAGIVDLEVEDRRIHVVEVALGGELEAVAQRNLDAEAGLERAQEAVLERHEVEAGQRQHEARRLVVDPGAGLEPHRAVVAGWRVGERALRQLVAHGEPRIDRGPGRGPVSYTHLTLPTSDLV